MSVRGVNRMFLILVAVLFAFHVQAMDHPRTLPHGHEAERTSHADHGLRCGSACCSTSACCVQAASADEIEAPVTRSPVYGIDYHREMALAAVAPPDPPPRSPFV